MKIQNKKFFYSSQNISTFTSNVSNFLNLQYYSNGFPHIILYVIIYSPISIIVINVCFCYKTVQKIDKIVMT